VVCPEFANAPNRNRTSSAFGDPALQRAHQE
jgi:hypothetical protein